jgi:hypothetical protein
MSHRKLLLSLTYHSDDDSGTYHVGEVDYSLYSELDDYLKTFQQEGYNDLMLTLCHLIAIVNEKWSETPRAQKPDPAQCVLPLEIPPKQ